ncbi:MAG: hypothetical protein HOJ35_04865 [Bdellovibrionales bacterium]|nr:hypothetical protein [Bdellovibrionales bacterium]
MKNKQSSKLLTTFITASILSSGVTYKILTHQDNFASRHIASEQAVVEEVKDKPTTPKEQVTQGAERINIQELNLRIKILNDEVKSELSKISKKEKIDIKDLKKQLEKISKLLADHQSDLLFFSQEVSKKEENKIVIENMENNIQNVQDSVTLISGFIAIIDSKDSKVSALEDKLCGQDKKISNLASKVDDLVSINEKIIKEKAEEVKASKEKTDKVTKKFEQTFLGMSNMFQQLAAQSQSLQAPNFLGNPYSSYMGINPYGFMPPMTGYGIYSGMQMPQQSNSNGIQTQYNFYDNYDSFGYGNGFDNNNYYDKDYRMINNMNMPNISRELASPQGYFNF